MTTASTCFHFWKREIVLLLRVSFFTGALLAQTRLGLPIQSGVVAPEALSIHIYNLAGVSSWTLSHATQDAARVLATAGVDTVCWQVRADSPEAHIIDRSPSEISRKNRQVDSRGYLVVIIARGFPAGYFPGALGYALPDAQIGVNATIFYDRLERFNESREIDSPTLLGHAMAHEIGHVLLGSADRHAASGIMKTHWSKADFQCAGPSFMNFTPSERAEVMRRLTLIASRPCDNFANNSEAEIHH